MMLAPQTLTARAFAPFGDVVSIDGRSPLVINQGFAQRFDDLAGITASKGEVKVSIFTANPRPAPIEINLMERHPLGSQMFYPLQDRPWLIVVCVDPRNPDTYVAFTATGQQGINYKANTWHFPLLVLDAMSRFMVVDRKGPGNNLEEFQLEQPLYLRRRP